ncbi:MAG TPA: 2-C-methyl-D-erythritol 4-phosphate cytidylyltransferase [Phycisphaerales bacterium]|nr:2-C-methyl-D-erythritol 4-phosphate cytidylyltransferase [Phycisphaerales bacterium]HRQ74563.1 2-C-methyl-D-erythritol 4-phosphate cytidylyltransferase [Phycisphaerales bacterium]
MSTAFNVCVIIPAAGRSSRFSVDGYADKLAQDLGGRALLLRTVEAFTKRDEVRSIIVAGPPDDFEQFQARYGPTLGFHGAQLVRGGKRERWETVRNALAAVPDDATHIAVHDAARPAISDKLLDRLFHAARTLSAVIPAVPIAGTIKKVSTDTIQVGEDDEDSVADLILGEESRVVVPVRRIETTVDRTRLWEVQTPQIFEVDLLRRAYAQESLDGATDDASLVERLGESVYVVEGETTNIKVTTPGDLRLVRSILGVKPPAERPAHKQF